MKKAHITMTKEALGDILFGTIANSGHNITIHDIIATTDSEIFLTISGDTLPDKCLEGRPHVALQIAKDVKVIDGKPYSNFTYTIVVR